jgi:hypothetical protein
MIGAMRIPRRAALSLPALSLPAQATGRVAAAMPPAGHVAALTGAAMADGAARRVLAEAAPVFEGDRIATDPAGRCTLRLGPALTVRLGGAVSLRIDRFLLASGGVLALEQGPAMVDRAGGPPVALRGPFGLIAVRGTRFYAGPSAGLFAVFVERGQVLLASADQAVEVGPGEGADIPAPGAPPSAPRRWGAARIAAALALVQ